MPSTTKQRVGLRDELAERFEVVADAGARLAERGEHGLRVRVRRRAPSASISGVTALP